MTSKVTNALLALATIAGLTGEARGQSQNELIEQRMLPHLEHLFQTGRSDTNRAEVGV